MAVPSTDTDELVRFGYKQELDRSLRRRFASPTSPPDPDPARGRA
jgi:hypothetical protein